MNWNDKYDREATTILMELTRLLSMRVSWADRVEIGKAMRDVRLDLKSMNAEYEHLGETQVHVDETRADAAADERVMGLARSIKLNQ